MPNNLKLASRYFFMANKLKYDNFDNPNITLFDFACGKGDKKKVNEIIDKSLGFNTFLKLIADKNSLKMHDKKVIEAYWIGNSLLDKVSFQDVRKMIHDDFVKKGLDAEYAKQMAESVPEGALAHHSFHIMHINYLIKAPFGITAKCIIRRGLVTEVGKDMITVRMRPIAAGGGVSFAAPEEREIKYERLLLPYLKKGDNVAIHWEMAVDKLTKVQAEALEKYTLQNMIAMGSLGKK